MARTLLKNGRVIDPATSRDGIADVRVENGRVTAVGRNLGESDSEVFDATGLVVAPGFIDMHVHLRGPGFVHAETIETGSRAAAAGGFTSVCAMPNTEPVNDSATVTSYIVDRARRFAQVNVFPIGAITKGSAGEELSSYGSMKNAGIVAISDDGKPVMNSRVMRRAMEFARAFGLVVIDHCEDLHLSAGGDMHESFESVRYGLRGIPGCSEDVMVARDILLAESTGAHFHAAHVSTRRGVQMIAEAKARGLAVTAEATPHHMALCDAAMAPYDSNFKMKPPLRTVEDAAGVVEGLVSGAIDVIASDHAPHAGSEKMQEFERCPFGIIGLETSLAVALEVLVHPGKLPLMRLVELMSLGPARVLNLDRGRLVPGAVADITLFNPELVWTYDVNRSYSKSRNTPFHGRTFRGAPVATMVNGQFVWSRDKEC
ncbi:MAG: dihydroorotase [Acidobacteria bacterium]|nr:dihydroorotase [Acidobacteriota bacterium]